ncbi:MAG: hypothetical protein WAV73_02825 [Candidatus Moraniibacteriota bacterium]
MLFFSKLKQKISKTIFTRSRKSYLAIFGLSLFFVFFYSHNAQAGPVDWAVGAMVETLLKAVLQFCAMLLSMAETIFKWIVNADNMKAIMDNEVVYSTWRTVRDFFNIAFIMVLLFSAFATIFQAPTNFNYKKILLNLVIMALLVNFSYPIARFIVDASNMMMFGILKNLDGSNSFMEIIQKSKLADIFTSGKDSTDLLYLLSAIIFTFIYAVTLLVIAVLLTIRTIAITIYIIFSPIAFIGPIVPGTAVASAGNDWWKEFMKYCFSGPTMIFMLFIATRMMVAVTDSQIKMGEIAMTQVRGDTSSNAVGNLITSASKFSLPIIILWIGIIQAQKSGIAGAGAVVGMGTKALNKAGKWAAGAPTGAAWWAAKKTGVPGGVQQKWANWKKGGILGSDRQAEREARVAGALGVPRVTDQMYMKKLKEAGESHDMPNMGVNALRELSRGGDRYESAAAIQELMNQNAFDMNNGDDAAAYQRMQQEFGTTSQVFSQINNKLKAFDPVSAFAHITDALERQARTVEFMNSNKFKAENLGARSLGNSNFMETAFKEGAITNDDLEKLRKKSPTHERNILSSLRTAANNFGDPGQLQSNIDGLRELPQSDERDAQITLLDNDLRRARSIHTAHLAQTGTFHTSLSDDASLSDAERNMRADSRTHIISRLNEDTAKRTRIDTGTPGGDENLRTEFAQNLNSNKFKAIMTKMDNDSVVAGILDTARKVGGPPGSAGARNAQKAIEDVDLKQR